MISSKQERMVWMLVKTWELPREKRGRQEDSGRSLSGSSKREVIRMRSGNQGTRRVCFQLLAVGALYNLTCCLVTFRSP